MSVAEPAPLSRPIGVILGASNVTRCIGTVVHAANEALGGSSDLRIAAGRGRSYGTWSRVGPRSIPSIAESALWRELQVRPIRRALITDIGNDIMYGQPSETILTWVEDAARRCADAGATVTFGRLPMVRLRQLRSLPYEIARSLLFPRHARQTLDEVLRCAERVDEGIVELAHRIGGVAVDLDVHWYGLDPIHIRRRIARDAWRTIFASWCDPIAQDRAKPAIDGDRVSATAFDRLRDGARLTRTLPREAKLCGFALDDPSRAATTHHLLRERIEVRLY